MTRSPLDPYDAVLLVSFGGPEGPDDVLPFLRRVTAGKGIPDERLAQVGQHYSLFGGRSPINDQCRALLAALRSELDARGIDTPLIWGNRNSAPFLEDTLREAGAVGHERVLAVTTSAYSCYSSCRQYRENLAAAQSDVRATADPVPEIDKVAPYAPRPGFLAAQVERVRGAVDALAHVPDHELALVFVTHSIPTAMDDTSGPGDGEGSLYQQQHLRVAHGVTAAVEAATGRRIASSLAYCSRSGPPAQPWLEPDVNDHLEALHAGGVRTVVCVPIGFTSDHMEVIYDLDTEAAATAERLGLGFVRVPTLGTSPAFVADLVDALIERAAERRGDPVRDIPGRCPSVCPSGCCPNLRAEQPALCGRD